MTYDLHAAIASATKRLPSSWSLSTREGFMRGRTYALMQPQMGTRSPSQERSYTGVGVTRGMVSGSCLEGVSALWPLDATYRAAQASTTATAARTRLSRMAQGV